MEIFGNKFFYYKMIFNDFEYINILINEIFFYFNLYSIVVWLLCFFINKLVIKKNYFIKYLLIIRFLIIVFLELCFKRIFKYIMIIKN